MKQRVSKYLTADTPHTWDGWDGVQFVQIMVMLHIKLKGITNAPTNSGNHGKPGKSSIKVPCKDNNGI